MIVLINFNNISKVAQMYEVDNNLDRFISKKYFEAMNDSIARVKELSDSAYSGDRDDYNSQEWIDFVDDKIRFVIDLFSRSVNNDSDCAMFASLDCIKKVRLKKKPNSEMAICVLLEPYEEKCDREDTSVMLASDGVYTFIEQMTSDMSESEYYKFIDAVSDHVIFSVQINTWYKKEKAIAVICDIHDDIIYHN